jgi:hypothetical protein
MRDGVTKLPPWWIRIFSSLFVLFLCTPIVMIANIAGMGKIEFLGMRFDREDGDPLGWMLMLDTLFFTAGITALGILQRRSWAYDFGLGYVATAILVGGAGMWTYIGQARYNCSSGALHIACLFVFGFHLLRHRSNWRNQIADGSDSPIPEPIRIEPP